MQTTRLGEKGWRGQGILSFPLSLPPHLQPFVLSPTHSYSLESSFAFTKSTVVKMRDTLKSTSSAGYNSFKIFSQCLISQKSSFQQRIKKNITIIVLPFWHVVLLFDWLETTAGIIRTTCKPCICKGYI